MEPKDYFLVAIGLFVSTFVLVLIAGLLSMLAVSTEDIEWIYLTIPSAIFAFTTGLGFVIAGILKILTLK